MRKNLLSGVFPVAIALLVCTLGVLFLSATGLLHEPRAAASAVPNGTEAAALDSLGQPLAALDTVSSKCPAFQLSDEEIKQLVKYMEVESDRSLSGAVAVK